MPTMIGLIMNEDFLCRSGAGHNRYCDKCRCAWHCAGHSRSIKLTTDGGGGSSMRN